MPWLRFFRVVNLPTVPGDVLVGAAMALWSCRDAAADVEALVPVALAAVASCGLYLFGLADNDIVGAATDEGRPIPAGAISMRAARAARAACIAMGLLAIVVTGALPFAEVTAAFEMLVAFVLVAVIVVYNRTKRPLLMGLCRGLNVVLGVSAIVPPLFWPRMLRHAPLAACAIAAVVAAWTIYVAAVTWYSEGEERDPSRRRRVGRLIGAIPLLQIAVLAVLAASCPSAPAFWLFLFAAVLFQAVLLIAQRLLPSVRAS